jgi:alpha-amylase
MGEQVVNHVAATASGNFVPNDSYGPFNSTAQYHPFCWVDGELDKIAFSTCRVNLLV